MHQLPACRLCGNTELIEVLDLGMQFANDVFPKSRTEQPEAAPLKLVKCTGGPHVCGLLQLGHCRSERELCSPTPGTSTETVSLTADAVRRTVATPPSMLSRLEQPGDFLQRIRDALDDHTAWILREPYMPSIVWTNSYDSISHDQLAYYALKQIRWIADRVGLRIVSVDLDAASGSAASIILSRPESPYISAPSVETVLDEEAREGLHTLQPYQAFAQRVTAGIALLRMFLDRARYVGKSVCALGATKEGNVILQCCRATPLDIAQVGETDLRKVGAFTPGTLLPIVREEDVLAARPDFLLVLRTQPREGLMSLPRFSGRNLLFPIPELEVVRATAPH